MVGTGQLGFKSLLRRYIDQHHGNCLGRTSLVLGEQSYRSKQRLVMKRNLVSGNDLSFMQQQKISAGKLDQSRRKPRHRPVFQLFQRSTHNGSKLLVGGDVAELPVQQAERGISSK